MGSYSEYSEEESVVDDGNLWGEGYDNSCQIDDEMHYDDPSAHNNERVESPWLHGAGEYEYDQAEVVMDSYGSSYEEGSSLHYTYWAPREHAYGDNSSPSGLALTFAHKGMTLAYESAPDFNEYEHVDYGSRMRVNDGCMTRGIRQAVCDDVHVDNCYDNHNYLDAEITEYDYNDKVHEYINHWEVDYAGMSGYTEHEVDVEYTPHLDECGNIERIGYGQYGQTDFCQFPSMPNTTAQSDLGAKLELLVKEHELSVKEHGLYLKEQSAIRKDLESLRSRLERLIEEEKCKKLEGSFLGLERQKLGDYVVAFMDDQGLEGNEVKLVDKISSNERVEETDLVEISEENERKEEPSVGLQRAMKFLELQQQIWGIGSLMSVIPAVPLHHFEDPFLAGMRKVEVVPRLPITTGLKPLFESNLNQFLSSLGAASNQTSKHSLLTYDNELPVSLRSLLLASCPQHLQTEWRGTRLGAWHALWRPPDVRVPLYNGLVCLPILCDFWFGIWRPPDLICRYWRLGSNMLGFWFDIGRPPDIWDFPHLHRVASIHRVASRTKPFKRGCTDAFAEIKGPN